ncbi:MAG: 4Fe-4S dicluster domain-containing protein [Planctomycetaceae bacterium]|jgi:ferredoxin|nr:4Fe-4S dicluster domain-containing protein [Planctomycetaceae bacterium]
MQNKLQETARELLAEKKVDVVIGYGETETGAVGAVFIRNPNDVGKLIWDVRCRTNLATYLKRKEVRKLGKPAVVVKGCDSRSIRTLIAESQLKRDDVVVIGMACEGVIDEIPGKANLKEGELALKCTVCDVHQPLGCDVVIGETQNAEIPTDKRYAALERITALPPSERLAYWSKQFERCFKCYACRQSCPLCYCNVCIADKNRPVAIEQSSSLKGNFAWQIVRAFHLAGRCSGCGECARACPAGIELTLLNNTLAKSAEKHFDYRAGMKDDGVQLIGAYSEQDQEEFIR